MERLTRGLASAAGVAVLVTAVALPGAVVEGIVWAQDASGWREAGALPKDFHPEEVALSSERCGVVVGSFEGKAKSSVDRLRLSRGAIFFSSDTGKSWGRVLDAPGYVKQVHFRDEKRGWALLGRLRSEGEGSLYFVLGTEDGGKSWSEVGPVPATSVSSVTRTGAATGWAHGVATLMSTTDGGKSWSAVVAPGERNGVSESLAARSEKEIALAGKGLLRTTDGGATWTSLEAVATARVLAGDDYLVAREADDTVRVGRLRRERVDWLGSLDKGILADAIVVEGEVVRVRAFPAKGREGLGTLIYTSRDGGATFDMKTAPALDTRCVGLWGAKAAWTITLDRRVLVAP